MKVFFAIVNSFFPVFGFIFSFVVFGFAEGEEFLAINSRLADLARSFDSAVPII